MIVKPNDLKEECHTCIYMISTGEGAFCRDTHDLIYYEGVDASNIDHCPGWRPRRKHGPKVRKNGRDVV